MVAQNVHISHFTFQWFSEVTTQKDTLAGVKSILICNQVESEKEAIRAHQKKILKNKRKEAEVFQFTREDFEKKYGNCLNITTQSQLPGTSNRAVGTHVQSVEGIFTTEEIDAPDNETPSSLILAHILNITEIKADKENESEESKP